MSTEDDEVLIKWQPVMMILGKHRLECECGALAVFVTADIADNQIEDASAWCQDCFERKQSEDETEE